MSKKQRIPIVIVVVVVVATAVWFWFSRKNGNGTITASGTIEATEADLGFQTTGRAQDINVREGDRVTKGQELARLDLTEMRARREAAEAQVAAARASLDELESGYRSEEVEQGRARFRAAEQRLNDTKRDLERVKRLFEGGAVSQQRYDDAQTAYELAQSEYDSAKEALRILETGPRKERIATQRAMLKQAEASVAQIDAAIDFAVVKAPFDGLITVRHREPGETVPAGAPVVTLMNPDDRWVRIYVREDEVGHISIGDPATIRGDANRSRDYTGKVVFIASEAEFTPRNVQTTAERVKLVYRVKVQITGDPEFDLKPGLAADVYLGPDGN